MKVLLDTDVLSAILTGRGGRYLRDRLDAVPPASQHISAISLAELLYGMERSGRHADLREVLEVRILPLMTMVPFDEPAAREYALLRAMLEHQGRMLAEADLRIASTALAHRVTLITGNTKHFRRVPGLRVEDWLTPV